MRRRSGSILGLGLLFAVAAAHGAETKLTGEATLRTAPENGAVLGLLTADAPVTELARQGEWVRVRVEGWVRSRSVAAGSPSAVAPASVSVQAVAVASANASPAATLEGTLQVTLVGGAWKKKVLGTGQSVWLLPAAFDLESVGPLSSQDSALVTELEVQADKLAREAERAMHGSNFTEATMRNDALMKQRREVLERRAEVLAGSHRQREAAARQSAIATAVVDSRGSFFFPAVVPGAYRVYARLANDRQLDLEWIESVDVGTTGAKIALDETRAKGLPKGS